MCTGCQHFDSHARDPQPQVATPLGAGYCETNWAPLMTVETLIESEIVLEETHLETQPHNELQDATPVPLDPPPSTPLRETLPTTSRAVPPRQRIYQPLRQHDQVPQEIADEIEQNFEMALQHSAPSAEEPRLLHGHPTVHVSPRMRSLSEMIQSSPAPIQQVSHWQQKRVRNTKSSGSTVSSVDTIIELLHDNSGRMEAAGAPAK